MIKNTGKLLIALLLLITNLNSFAQRTITYDVSLSGYVAAKDNLPFWATANKFGIVPNQSNFLIQSGIFSDFNKQHKVQMAYGVSFAGAVTSFNGTNSAFIDQLFISAKWKFLRLDAGIIHPDIEYNGVSSTNGDILYSTNARNMPGINLRTDYFSFPYLEKFIAFKLNLAEYRMTDDRYIKKTRVHNKAAYVKIKPWKRLELIVGVEHYAQWGGYSPIDGKQPSSFKDYLRIFAGKEGDARSSQSSQLNVLGNHIGREHIRINYLADKFMISAYHDIPAEDRSGIKFRTVPDGLYGIYFGKTEKKGWITDIAYEFYYTKYQAGPHHDRPATPEEMEKQDPNSPWYGKVILGGNDNYFNHGEYRSGWTMYGNPICSPFFTPISIQKNHVITLNNRFVAHYVGIKGFAFNNKVPYFFRASYTMNYGTYSIPLEDKPRQVSLALEAGLPSIKKLPFNIDLGIYGDFGELFSNNVGISIKLSRKAILSTLK